MHTEHKTQGVHEQFLEQTGLDFAAVLAPLDAASPAGVSLRDDAVYTTIKEARREDDASLEQGVWEHDLKKANWDRVAETALSALHSQSKDLQLAVWLLEAHLHRFAFAAVAPCMALIAELCARFWESMYPQMINGDRDYRTNLIAWVNDKLQPTLRLLPITARQDTESDFCWADWAMAKRRESIRVAHPDAEVVEPGVTTEQLERAILHTPDSFFLRLADELEQGIAATERLVTVIDEYCEQDAPSLSGFRGVLDEIHDMVCAQLDQRGLFPLSSPSANDEAPDDNEESPLPHSVAAGTAGIRDRLEAYGRLRHIAEFLAADDPHSPVPYLLMKAVEWGGLNTSELYRQLFVQQKGQLDIFDILGVAADGEQRSPGG